MERVEVYVNDCLLLQHPMGKFNELSEVVDIVSFRKLRSDDNAIIHGSDERQGDKIGDDEKIDLFLNRMNPAISYISFVINSFSGQERDDVRKASCHLFDSTTGVDIASYKLTSNGSLDKRTGVIMSVLYLDDNGSWCMRIISEPGGGRIASDLADEMQEFLKNNPPPCVQEVPEPEIAVHEMPQDIEIPITPIIPSHEIVDNVVIPTVPVPGKSNVSTGGIFVPNL